MSPPSEPEHAALVAAYRRSIYQVRLPAGLQILSLDQPLPESLASKGGAFVTAHNPRSHPHSDEDNAEAQRRLLQRLQRDGFTFFPGEGRSPDGDWSEESVWVVGMPRGAAQHIAQDFAQTAYLFAEPDGVLELVFTL
jgi:hypothetical protein